MKLIRRFLYLVYYFKESEFKLLYKFLRFSSVNTGRSKCSIIADVIKSSVKYNISFKDYFYFGFFEYKMQRREDWAGTGFMYEYQLLMNPRSARKILENKVIFLNHYKDLIKRNYLHVSQKNANVKAIDDMLRNQSGRLVLKGSYGQVGAEVEIIECDNFKPDTLFKYMKKRKYDLIEEFVIQHPDLNELSFSGLNTVRIITQLFNDEVVCLGARLRISVNSPVDNMAAGNLAAPIDSEAGVVNGPGVYSDITKESVKNHPITGMPIEGFQIPFWKKTMQLVETAARRAEGNRSVGWDIAITANGPELIEGNHNWCKLLWQLPVNKGLKNELLRFL